MKDRASLHLVKDNAAVVEGVTIQMLVLFHASLNIPAQPSSQNLFAQFHFVFGDGRDLSLFLRVPENQSHIVSLNFRMRFSLRELPKVILSLLVSLSLLSPTGGERRLRKRLLNTNPFNHDTRRPDQSKVSTMQTSVSLTFKLKPGGVGPIQELFLVAGLWWKWSSVGRQGRRSSIGRSCSELQIPQPILTFQVQPCF